MSGLNQWLTKRSSRSFSLMVQPFEITSALDCNSHALGCAARGCTSGCGYCYRHSTMTIVNSGGKHTRAAGAQPPRSKESKFIGPISTGYLPMKLPSIKPASSKLARPPRGWSRPSKKSTPRCTPATTLAVQRCDELSLSRHSSSLPSESVLLLLSAEQSCVACFTVP